MFNIKSFQQQLIRISTKPCKQESQTVTSGLQCKTYLIGLRTMYLGYNMWTNTYLLWWSSRLWCKSTLTLELKCPMNTDIV